MKAINDELTEKNFRITNKPKTKWSIYIWAEDLVGMETDNPPHWFARMFMRIFLGFKIKKNY